MGMRLCRRSDLLFNSYNNLGTTDLKERLDRAPVVLKKEAKKFKRRPSYWAQKTCESQRRVNAKSPGMFFQMQI